MLESPATRLVAFLRGGSLRNSTGILLLPATWLGREAEVAARLGISYEDQRQAALSRLRPGQRYFGWNWTELINEGLTPLIQDAKPDGLCVMVGNVDLLLGSLRSDERNSFWRFLRESYRPPWGLLLVLPVEIRRLMAEDERALWTRDGRLAIWEGGTEQP